MKKNNIIILSIMSIIILVLIVTVIYYVNQTKEKETEISEIAEMMNFEKEQVEREFQDLTTEFDGYSSNIKNDSLFKLLENQKLKVQQLLEELKVTKSTDARRIKELKNELATVRSVMVRYVKQIDSLNIENRFLKTENVEVRRKYNEATQTVEQLSKEKNNLTEVVGRASKLNASNLSMVPLNNRNRKVTWFSKIANLEFNYTINKNITAPVGMKTLYLRITRPDGEVLTKNPNNVFPFEDKNIIYSAKKDFEYAGEEIRDVIYWKIEEIIQQGNYRADFFADGQLIGSLDFEIKK